MQNLWNIIGTRRRNNVKHVTYYLTHVVLLRLMINGLKIECNKLDTCDIPSTLTTSQIPAS